MHILIVTPHFWPENFRINDFADGFIERGHKITVLTATPDYPEGKIYHGFGFFKRSHEIWHGIDIYRSPTIPRGKGKRWQLFINYLSFVISGSITSLFFIRKQIEIIFVHEPSPITVGIPAIVLKKIKRIPMIFWVLDLWPESVIAAGNLKSGFIPKLLIPLVKYIYINSDKILVSSKGFVSSIIEKGIEEKKIIYFPQWAETIFKPIEIHDKSIDDKFPVGFTILFAGNIGEAQDFNAILNAAELLKTHENIHWIILGDGRKFNFVREQIRLRQIDKTFHLLGKYPLEVMPHFYSRASALLLSLKKEKIFSLTVPAKLQSYLACGRPILTMLDGEGSAIVDQSKAGLTCGAGDFTSLAENILRMYSMDKKYLDLMGKNGREYYLANFERNMLFDKLEKIFIKHLNK